ncbi:MAG: hypothetical protein Q7R54_01655 [bacterium]|nr:hypothetical protein [bacterium]
MKKLLMSLQVPASFAILFGAVAFWASGYFFASPGDTSIPSAVGIAILGSVMLFAGSFFLFIAGSWEKH